MHLDIHIYLAKVDEQYYNTCFNTFSKNYPFVSPAITKTQIKLT